MQSSRVGVSTIAWVSSSSGSRYWSSGSPKAAVLPVPVCAWPITSWPASSSGIACSWTGGRLGVAELVERDAGSRASGPSSENVSSCGRVQQELARSAGRRGPRARGGPPRAGRRRRSRPRARPRPTAPSRSPIIAAISSRCGIRCMSQKPITAREWRIRWPVLTSFCSREAIPKTTMRPNGASVRRQASKACAAAHLEHRVDLLALVGLEDRRPQVLGARVDGRVGAQPRGQLALLLARGERDHPPAGALGELHRERAGAAGRRLDDDRLARPRAARSGGRARARSGPGAAAPPPGRRRPRRAPGRASPRAPRPSRRSRRPAGSPPPGGRPACARRSRRPGSAAGSARRGSRCGSRACRRS